MLIRNALMLTILSFSFAGCVSQLSTLKDKNSSTQKIYLFTAAEACQIANSAMEEVFPGNDIIDAGGATCGFSTLFRAPPLYADTYTEIVKVFPASGTDAKGENITGYFFEISGGGSSFLQGQLKASSLLKTISEMADKTGKGLQVSNAKPIPVQVVSASSKKPLGSIADRLKVLDELKEKGLLSDAEYTTKRKTIMDDL